LSTNHSRLSAATIKITNKLRAFDEAGFALGAVGIDSGGFGVGC
jgi:hypothetical protein